MLTLEDVGIDQKDFFADKYLKVINFNRDELKEWMKGRLNYDDDIFGFNPKHDETPSDMVCGVYKKVKNIKFSQNFENIVDELLFELLEDGDNDVVYELLCCVERIRRTNPKACQNSIELIKQSVKSGTHKGRETKRNFDLHRKMLSILADLKNGFDLTFFRDQMNDYRYAGVAFCGVFNILMPDFKATMEDFKKLVNLYMVHQDEMCLHYIVFLLDKYMGKVGLDFKNLVDQYFKKDTPEYDILHKTIELMTM